MLTMYKSVYLKGRFKKKINDYMAAGLYLSSHKSWGGVTGPRILTFHDQRVILFGATIWFIVCSK